jgi:hypothetical protein
MTRDTHNPRTTRDALDELNASDPLVRMIVEIDPPADDAGTWVYSRDEYGVMDKVAGPFGDAHDAQAWIYAGHNR